MRMLLGPQVSPQTIEQVARRKEEDYRQQVRAGGLELLRGVADWLDRLRAGGWRQAIGSSAPPENLELVLEVTHTRPYFERVISGADVARGKPDPEVFLAAATSLQVPPERCVVVEDAPDAVEGARSARFRTVGVRRASASAEIGVDSLDELSEDAFDRLVPGGPLRP